MSLLCVAEALAKGFTGCGISYLATENMHAHTPQPLRFHLVLNHNDGGARTCLVLQLMLGSVVGTPKPVSSTKDMCYSITQDQTADGKTSFIHKELSHEISLALLYDLNTTDKPLLAGSSHCN